MDIVTRLEGLLILYVAGVLRLVTIMNRVHQWLCVAFTAKVLTPLSLGTVPSGRRSAWWKRHRASPTFYELVVISRPVMCTVGIQTDLTNAPDKQTEPTPVKPNTTYITQTPSYYSMAASTSQSTKERKSLKIDKILNYTTQNTVGYFLTPILLPSQW